MKKNHAKHPTEMTKAELIAALQESEMERAALITDIGGLKVRLSELKMPAQKHGKPTFQQVVNMSPHPQELTTTDLDAALAALPAMRKKAKQFDSAFLRYQVAALKEKAKRDA